MTLILAGVTINSFAGALTALALNLSPNPYAAFEIMFWLMGSLADRSLPQLSLALPLMLVGWALLLSSAPALDALTLGEDTASEPRLRSRAPAPDAGGGIGAGGRRAPSPSPARSASSAWSCRICCVRSSAIGRAGCSSSAASAARSSCSSPTSRFACCRSIPNSKLGVVTALDRRAVPAQPDQSPAAGGVMRIERDDATRPFRRRRRARSRRLRRALRRDGRPHRPERRRARRR